MKLANGASGCSLHISSTRSGLPSIRTPACLVATGDHNPPLLRLRGSRLHRPIEQILPVIQGKHLDGLGRRLTTGCGAGIGALCLVGLGRCARGRCAKLAKKVLEFGIVLLVGALGGDTEYWQGQQKGSGQAHRRYL